MLFPYFLAVDLYKLIFLVMQDNKKCGYQNFKCQFLVGKVIFGVSFCSHKKIQKK